MTAFCGMKCFKTSSFPPNPKISYENKDILNTELLLKLRDHEFWTSYSKRNAPTIKSTFIPSFFIFSNQLHWFCQPKQNFLLTAQNVKFSFTVCHIWKNSPTEHFWSNKQQFYSLFSAVFLKYWYSILSFTIFIFSWTIKYIIPLTVWSDINK